MIIYFHYFIGDVYDAFKKYGDIVYLRLVQDIGELFFND